MTSQFKTVFEALAVPLLAVGALVCGQKVLAWGFALIKGIYKSKRRGRGLMVFFAVLLSHGVAFCQEPPPAPVVYENIMVWGFVSSVAVFGVLFGFYVVKKSIFRGLDLIERD